MGAIALGPFVKYAHGQGTDKIFFSIFARLHTAGSGEIPLVAMAVGLQRSGDWLAARRCDQCDTLPANHRCAWRTAIAAGGIWTT